MPKLKLADLRKQFPKPQPIKRYKLKKMKVEKTQNGYAIDGFNEAQLLKLYKGLSANKLAAQMLLGSQVQTLLDEIEKAIVKK